MALLWRRLLDLLDHTTLPALLGEELAKQGVDVSELGEDDIGFAAAALRSLITRLKTRTTWESHVGALLQCRGGTVQPEVDQGCAAGW